MDSLASLHEFLDRLERAKLRYRLDRRRPEFLMVEVQVAGEKWEIEFGQDGDIEIEPFRSSGDIYDRAALQEFWSLVGEEA